MSKTARLLETAHVRSRVVARNAQGVVGAMLVAVGVGWQVGAGWGVVVFGGFLLLGAAVS